MRRHRRIKTERLWLAALALAVSLHLWSPESGPRQPHDTYSTNAPGKKAFYLLVGERAISAERIRQPLERMLSRVGIDETVCILGPERPPRDAEWESLLEWVAAGGQLLYVPGIDREEGRIEQLGIGWEAIERGRREERQAEDEAPLRTKLLSGGDWVWRTRRQLDAEGAEVLVEFEGAVQAVRVPHGAGRVVVVASDFVFSNQSLAWGDNSRLAYGLLAAAGEPLWVRFDESLNESGTPKVVGLLFDPWVRPLTVQGIVLLLAFAWWRSRRFGPLIPSAQGARHDIVDHTDAVGMWLYRGRDGRTALRGYLRQMLDEIGLRRRGPRTRTKLERVARRAATTTDAVEQTLSGAMRVARSQSVERRRAAGTIRELAALRRAAGGTAADGGDAAG